MGGQLANPSALRRTQGHVRPGGHEPLSKPNAAWSQFNVFVPDAPSHEQHIARIEIKGWAIGNLHADDPFKARRKRWHRMAGSGAGWAAMGGRPTIHVANATWKIFQ